MINFFKSVFLSAFFICQISMAGFIDNIPNSAPKKTGGWSGTCETYGATGTGTAPDVPDYYNILKDNCNLTLQDGAQSWLLSQPICSGQKPTGIIKTDIYTSSNGGTGMSMTVQCPDGTPYGNTRQKSFPFTLLTAVRSENESCPGTVPSHTSSTTLNGSMVCYDPKDADAYNKAEAELAKNNDVCKQLLLGAGNNTASTMCYTAPSGLACNVKKNVDGNGGSYYTGTDSNPFGCANSSNPPYDNTNLDNSLSSQGCFVIGTTQYCNANPDKHTKLDENGNVVVDDGCITSGGKMFCDSGKFADVGNGDSDFFDSNGSCIGGTGTYKGACMDSGGTWSKQITSGTADNLTDPFDGTCSDGTSNNAYTCLDVGATWTANNPDVNESKDTKALVFTANKSKEQADTLKQLELTTRKIGEQTTSVIKSGNNKIVDAINNISISSGDVNLDLTPVVDELKKINNPTVTTNSNLNTSGLTGFWDTSYPDGVSGIFNQQKAAFLSSEFVVFLNKFNPTLSKGSSPSMTFCFNLGKLGNYGCKELTVDPRIWSAIRIFILVTAGFLCRKILFGG